MHFMLSCSHQNHINYKITQKIEGQIITDGKLVVKAKYVCYVQVGTNWYCNQHPQSMLSQCQHAQYLIHDLK